MEIIKVNVKLTNEERETHINYDPIDKVWTLYSTIPKHFRRALKQGWTLVKEYIDEDGVTCGMILTAPERSITIRSIDKKQLSEKQLQALNSEE